MADAEHDAQQPYVANALERAEFMENLRFFAHATPRVRRACAGPETGFATRFLPSLSGGGVTRGVASSEMPRDGYKTFDHAYAAAGRFKEECRAALAKAVPLSPTAGREDEESKTDGS